MLIRVTVRHVELLTGVEIQKDVYPRMDPMDPLVPTLTINAIDAQWSLCMWTWYGNISRDQPLHLELPLYDLTITGYYAGRGEGTTVSFRAYVVQKGSLAPFRLPVSQSPSPPAEDGHVSATCPIESTTPSTARVQGSCAIDTANQDAAVTAKDSVDGSGFSHWIDVEGNIRRGDRSLTLPRGSGGIAIAVYHDVAKAFQLDWSHFLSKQALLELFERLGGIEPRPPEPPIVPRVGGDPPPPLRMGDVRGSIQSLEQRIDKWGEAQMRAIQSMSDEIRGQVAKLK